MTPRTWQLLTLTTGLLLAASAQAQAQTGPRVLFDAAHAQLAGNADWVLDEDGCGNVPRFPTPAQSGITASTPETYWTGAYSSFGVALAKAGYQLESLPPGNTFTYGNGANPQDLTNYDALVIPEPNTRFTTAEITALQNFVQNGGGLFMIGDHSNSDRNFDGFDSPEIFNELLAGTPWGLHFQVAPEPDNNITNDPDANYTADTTSPIIYTGPFGAARAGLGLSLHGATTLTLDPTQNPNVRGHVWTTSGIRDTNTRVTLATGSVGAGRIAAIGDSGPNEDITNACNDTTFDDFNLTNRDNATITLNVVAWLTAGGPVPDTTPPTAPTNLVASAVSMSQIDLAWTAATDNLGVVSYTIYRSSDGFSFDAYLNLADTSFADTGLLAGTTYSYYVTALDDAGNESPASDIASATTFAAAPPRIIINEILANEVSTNTEGEFVELFNAGPSPVALDGWTVSDAVGARHVFAAGTTLSPGRAIVVFASATGIPAGLSNAVAASSNALGLSNSGDTVTLRDAGGTAIDSFTYPSSLASRDGVSMNRLPDASPTGAFVLHTALSTAASSPGRRVNGASF